MPRHLLCGMLPRERIPTPATTRLWTARRMAQHSASHHIPLHCTALHCTALHCTALHCTALHCTALHCTALHCTPQHSTSHHSTAQHITAQHSAHPALLSFLGCRQGSCSPPPPPLLSCAAWRLGGGSGFAASLPLSTSGISVADVAGAADYSNAMINSGVPVVDDVLFITQQPAEHGRFRYVTPISCDARVCVRVCARVCVCVCVCVCLHVWW
jgi:hypothetical protein